jgi:hypothetical protein
MGLAGVGLLCIWKILDFRATRLLLAVPANDVVEDSEPQYNPLSSTISARVTRQQGCREVSCTYPPHIVISLAPWRFALEISTFSSLIRSAAQESICVAADATSAKSTANGHRE